MLSTGMEHTITYPGLKGGGWHERLGCLHFNVFLY